MGKEWRRRYENVNEWSISSMARFNLVNTWGYFSIVTSPISASGKQSEHWYFEVNIFTNVYKDLNITRLMI